jgi:hypothetical protein
MKIIRNREELIQDLVQTANHSPDPESGIREAFDALDKYESLSSEDQQALNTFLDNPQS